MRWKIIPGFSMYEASDCGHVRRAKNRTERRVGHRKKPGELLKPLGKKYYSYTLMSDTGQLATIRANRLVLFVFKGPPPTPKHQAAHWDDNQKDNRLGNLRWATSKENGEDKIRNDKAAKGEGNAAAVLTEENVLGARKDYKKGHTLHELTVKYKVTTAPLWAAITGKSWAHLPGSAAKRGQGYREPSRVPRGVKNGNAKLTEDIVRKIKRLLPTTKGVVLAKRFGTTTHTISAIKRGVVWKHVNA